MPYRSARHALTRRSAGSQYGSPASEAGGALKMCDLTWIDLLLAVLAADLTVPVAFHCKDNDTTAFCIMAAIAMAGGRYLEYRHRWRDREPIAWAVIALMILVHLALLSGAAISRQFPPKASLFYRLVRAVTGRPICGWNGAVGVAVQAPGGRTTVDIAERSPDPVVGPQCGGGNKAHSRSRDGRFIAGA